MTDSALIKRRPGEVGGSRSETHQQEPAELASQIEQLVERRDVVALDGMVKSPTVNPKKFAEAMGLYLSGTTDLSRESQVGRASRLGKLLGEILAGGADLRAALEHFFDRVTVRVSALPGTPPVNPKVVFLQGLAFGSRSAPRVRFELLHLADQSRDRFVAKEAQNLLKSS